MADIESSIMATKQGFENSFSSGDFYNKQTQDEQHLKNILDFLPINADMKILDLGTGSGYLSFPIAKKYSNISVIGLDIVEKALEVNRFRAKEEQIRNISFITYNGIEFRFLIVSLIWLFQDMRYIIFQIYRKVFLRSVEF